jgi:hypothetical protein
MSDRSTKTAALNAQGSEHDYRGMIVVIPTRNRSEFVKNAVSSLLAQKCRDRLDVFLSDNSTESSEIERNMEVVRTTRGLNLRYLRPPTPQSMSDHWDWALREALSASRFNHVLFLTDRMVFRVGGLDRVEEVARLDPRRIISFPVDRINDYVEPVVFERSIASGKCQVIPATRVLLLSSHMKFAQAMPRMLNSIAPRATLALLYAKHGRYFASVSPDYNFCFRSMALVDDFVLLDEPILVHYGIGRSNGASFSRGVRSKDNKDFLSNLPPSQEVFPSTPIPALTTVVNGITHEYNAARAESPERFPPINLTAYLAANALEISGFIDDEARQRAMALLSACPAPPSARPSWIRRLMARPKKWIFHAVTRKPSLTFPDRATALQHILRMPERHTLLDRARGIPYQFFLRRLYPTAWKA